MVKYLRMFLILAVFLMGCGSDLAGTYEHSGTTLELKGNGNFKMVWFRDYGGVDFNGTWKVLGKRVVLSFGPPTKGSPQVFTIKGANLEDENGTWQKQ